MIDLIQRIAQELAIQPQQVQAAVTLLDEGSTVPFISRYRKEVTGGLDDTQLRNLEERLGYLRELEERRTAVLKSIEEQGKLTPELNAAIQGADTKTRLEDLYAPYKQKRRTKAQIAREAGIEPLLDVLLADPTLEPEVRAADFLNADAGFSDSAAVLEGARQIFMERVAEDADLVGELRSLAWDTGLMLSSLVDGQDQTGAKFSDYFDFSEPLHRIPSHRALAMFRGRTEGALRLKLSVPGQDDVETGGAPGRCEARIAARYGLQDQGRRADAWLQTSARWAWRVKLHMQLENELFMRLRETAEEEAIRVFGENLRDLLLAAPAGPRATLGLDPGLRTGVKVVVVNSTGAFVDHTTIYPHEPKKQWDASIATLAALIAKHNVELTSIGNGTASRETDRLVKDLAKRHPELHITSIVVSEAGASVYSASEFAAREFPDLDVTLRGAVSIARRLQDPLAELVKIEPKAIGVGQYQHDLNQTRLARKLDAVVEDCVNAVGVEMNTASIPLLARVAGLSESLARNIVAHRDQHGPFKNRQQLLEVTRLGPKAFEQAAGFLRIMNGDNPLDASAVHPETYPVIERIISKTGRDIRELLGNSSLLKTLAANDYTDERFGEPTVRDIIRELDKPGRDPRPEFKTASFKEGVEKIADLKPGMILEGAVTNVANFGAFVDIGVHQDGLVHISMLTDKFVKDPREVVKAGDVVKVKVLEIDPQRKRISLTMRLTDDATTSKHSREQTAQARSTQTRTDKSHNKSRNEIPQPAGAMAEAFARLKR
ncbi:MAG: RNA-binding transcriptional accessory protein [Gammaproteobacteria bacterium]|nr:RNA-binding transcriptional accessory protein [Gammaproteobacteria bacterium]